MLKSTQTLVAGFRGGNRPSHAALAVALGLLAGMVCGWNLTCCFVLALAICLNLPTRLLIAAALAGAEMAWLADDATRGLGVALLDQVGIGHAIAALGDSPIVAMLGWDCYTMVGGAALAVVIAVPMGFLAALAASFRNRKAACVASPWLRPRGLPVAAAVIAVALATPWWIGPKLASQELLREFTEYNTAEVSAAGVQISLWTGKFVVRDLRIADPEHLDRDRLRIGRLVGKLSSGQLLRGRLQVHTVSLEHVRADVTRTQLAQATDDSAVLVEASANVATTPDDRSIEVDSYVHDWPAMRHDLAWLEWLASAVERLADAESGGEQSPLAAAPPARSSLGLVRPRVLIRQLSASDLAARWRLGRKALIELTSLTSDPRALPEPARLRVVAPQLAGELTVQFQLQGDLRRHAIGCSAYDLNLAEFVGPEPASRGAAAKATTNLTGEGWMDRQRLELPVQIEMEPHDMPLDGPGRFAGLEHEMWRKSLARLDRLRLEAVLGGPWAAPRLTVDADRLVEQLKHQLRAAGEHAFVLAIDERLARPDEDANVVLQTSGSESDPASPGVSRLSDDELTARNPHPDTFAESADARQTDAALPTPEYPSTATPEAPPPTAFAQQQSEATHAYSPNAYPSTDAPPAPPIRRESTGPLPGPVNLFVGLDPIATSAAPPPQAPRPDGNWTPPAGPPKPSNAVAEDDLFAVPDESEQPGKVVRHSFLARWSEVLRSRFNRASRVPEPEPIDELTPPIAPPSYESMPPAGPADEPGMPTVARQPWYQRMWR